MDERPPEADSIHAPACTFKPPVGSNVMRPLIAGNWKMHGTAPQLREIEAIASAVETTPAADILICPPFPLIARAAQVAAGRIALHSNHRFDVQPAC